MNRFSLRLFVALLFIIGCIHSAVAQTELHWVESVNHASSSFKDNLFKGTSNTAYMVNVATPAGLLIVGLAKKDPVLKKQALYTGGALLLNTLFMQGLKQIVHRQRPYMVDSLIIKRSGGGGYSFPSGHTSSAFNTATMLSMYYPKWYVIVPAYTWAGLVGYGRIYQGVHYPTDVIAGALIGSGTAVATFYAQKWIEKRRNSKLKNRTALAGF